LHNRVLFLVGSVDKSSNYHRRDNEIAEADAANGGGDGGGSGGGGGGGGGKPAKKRKVVKSAPKSLQQTSGKAKGASKRKKGDVTKPVGI
jgi:hypothetical protein